MKYCIECGKAMFTSNESIWIKEKNYPIHKKCKEIKSQLSYKKVGEE